VKPISAVEVDVDLLENLRSRVATTSAALHQMESEVERTLERIRVSRHSMRESMEMIQGIIQDGRVKW